MESHAAPLLTSDGKMVHLAVTRDVSERNAAEERERKITADAMAATAKFRAVFRTNDRLFGDHDQGWCGCGS